MCKFARFEASAAKEMKPGALVGRYAAGSGRSVRNYHSTLSNMPEERRFVQLYQPSTLLNAFCECALVSAKK